MFGHAYIYNIVVCIHLRCYITIDVHFMQKGMIERILVNQNMKYVF
jgi:hypothetical protein